MRARSFAPRSFALRLRAFIAPLALACLCAAFAVPAAQARPLRPAILCGPGVTGMHCSPWRYVAAPTVQVDPEVHALAAVSANDIWAVGAFYNSQSPALNTLTEHWNGSTWSVVPSPNPLGFGSTLTAVTAIATNDVWAVGYAWVSNGYDQTITLHWNGSAWSTVASLSPGPLDNLLTGVAAIAANDMWAVGTYLINNGSRVLAGQTLTEHWNGSAWSVVASPNPDTTNDELHAVTAIATNDVWAVGEIAGTEGTSSELTEHWNGSAWSAVSNPASQGGVLQGVAALSSTNVWAVGSTPYFPLAEHWNGTTWTSVPCPGGMYAQLKAITAVPGTNQFWAAGSGFRVISGSAQYPDLTEHWNGSTWQAIPGANAIYTSGYYALTAVVAASSQNIWAAGTISPYSAIFYERYAPASNSWLPTSGRPLRVV
ncbi:MAG: hypothetical protein OJF49_002357 [Ktedonobacterales bacterium]|jgi:hypothetical protein|nr:MAG: hypothetical protein OJF49_002357 [Ktedonobacterales bacterium]